MKNMVIATGAFSELTLKQVRFLYELSQRGPVAVMLFGDELTEALTGRAPKFPLLERKYFLESVRYAERVCAITELSQLNDVSRIVGSDIDGWFEMSAERMAQCGKIAQSAGIDYELIGDERLEDYPCIPEGSSSNNKKVIVTGCFDWFHSGHVRFLEEVSEYGDLYVVVGNDKNIEGLKGTGHPMFAENERRFVVGSIRFVRQCLIGTGYGWLDAEAEIRKIRPDIYAVNEDGDKEEKRRFCEDNGIEYLVLTREPREGLQRRTSTDLRGY